MARFVHVAPEPLRRRIERAGLRGQRLGFDVLSEGPREEAEVVFAMAVLPDFAATHQWVRELRRGRGQRVFGVYFQLDDRAEVYVGRFGQHKRRVSAAEAIAWLHAKPWGGEVLIPHAVPRSAIWAVREIRQDVGWLETPERNRVFTCACPVCIPKGTPGLVRRCRAIFTQALERAIAAGSDDEAVADELGGAGAALERLRGRVPPGKLLGFVRHDSRQVRRVVVSLLGDFSSDAVLEPLAALLDDADVALGLEVLESLLRSSGASKTFALTRERRPDLLPELIELLEWWPGAEATVVLRAVVASGPPELAAQATEILRRAAAEDEMDAEESR